MDETNSTDQWKVFAIADIKNRHKTLWTARLQKECPDLYAYAINQNVR